MRNFPNRHHRLSPPILLTGTKARATASAVSGGTPKPVGWWKVNEGSGTVLNDSSGHAYTMNISPAQSWSTLSGYSATCLVVSINAPNISGASAPTQLNFNYTQPFTAMGWVNYTSGGALINSLDASNSNQGWRLDCADSSSEIGFDLISNGNGALQVKSNGAALTASTTYHLAVTYNGSNTVGGISFYKNGVQVPTGTPSSSNLTGSTLTTGPINIASVEQGGFDFLDASIADVRVYAQALTPSQISALYAAGPV